MLQIIKKAKENQVCIADTVVNRFQMTQNFAKLAENPSLIPIS